MDNNRPIMVMAGGTGGHVFPALAVACNLREQGETIVWMGTHSGIESRLVAEANFPIEWLKVQGLRGKGMLVMALAPIKLLQACWQALAILRRHKPRAVLGMGGFVAGPGGLMAWLLRIPVVIHEQNAVIGFTNRLLSRIARISYFAFPQAARGVTRSVVVGNPVRNEILSIQAPQTRLADRSGRAINLLVLGGSLGARTLNEVVPDAIVKIKPINRPFVRHQCGPAHLNTCKQRYQKNYVEAEVLPFIDDMKAAYEWADIVICRAGAMTVAELAAAGVASILVPFPYAVDDHQYFNAEYLTGSNAAKRVRDKNFTADWLSKTLKHLSENRDEIISMACNARAVAYTDATEKVAQGVLKVALS